LQGAGDVLLADDLGEFLGTVFAGQDGITHAEETIIREVRGGMVEAKGKSFYRRGRRENPLSARRRAGGGACYGAGYAIGWCVAYLSMR
jgi:hypothetical protein